MRQTTVLSLCMFRPNKSLDRRANRRSAWFCNEYVTPCTTSARLAEKTEVRDAEIRYAGNIPCSCDRGCLGEVTSNIQTPCDLRPRHRVTSAYCDPLGVCMIVSNSVASVLMCSCCISWSQETHDMSFAAHKMPHMVQHIEPVGPVGPVGPFQHLRPRGFR